MTGTTEIKRSFFNALKRGTGEAYIIAREHSTIDFSALIIKGAVKNYAYDGQAENSRARYIWDIISLSPQREKIRHAVLDALATEQTDTWSLTHLFDLVKLYAQQGDQEARQAIYDRFLHHPIDYSDWVGYCEILELDGMDGLMFIAEKFGKYIDTMETSWQDNSIIRHFQQNSPQLNVWQELEKASETNMFIRKYLDCIQRTEENSKKHIRERQVFKDIIDEVLHSDPYIWRNKLTDVELTLIANRLLIEKNKGALEKLLYVFNYNRFPFDSEYILTLAKQRPTSRNRIVEFAVCALKYFQSDRIREFALDKISTAKNPIPYIDILTSNYQKNDYTLLTAIALKLNGADIIENLAISYIDIFTANKTQDCKEPLEVLYGKMNCGIHRHSILEILKENNVMSDRIQQEIHYDSYAESRELARTM